MLSYEITITVVPFSKMKAKIASWRFEKRLEATGTFKAVSIALKEVRAQQKLDKALRFAIRKGGLTIKAICLQQEKKDGRTATEDSQKVTRRRVLHHTKM